MLKKIKRKLKMFYLMSLMLTVNALPAFADEYGIPVVTDASSLGSKIVALVQSVGMPIGGAILFLSVCLCAVDMMLYKFNPEKKSSAMTGLMYVGGGGILLGSALFIAGFLIGTGQTLSN